MTEQEVEEFVIRLDQLTGELYKMPNEALLPHVRDIYTAGWKLMNKANVINLKLKKDEEI